ncbi:hypothetical protein [Rhizobium sp. LjRoot258]|uniref:hypothetical protein n=1 Tax=Rhizobium sp. LjRoot258 TaxID=3342299 RepID=UPI003ECC2A26
MRHQGFGLSSNYFTDREYGQRPAVSETIDERVWGAIHALIDMRIGNGAFGYRFTEQCLDGDGPCGCDGRAFAQFLQAEVPWIDWPLSRNEVPETPVVLDLLEFCAKAVGEPILGSYHSYQHHYHMRWDRDAGLAAFVAEVNVLFQRNGVAFNLDTNGHAQRILPQPIAQALGWTMFRTGDTQTDSLLEYARSHFLSPKLGDRRDAMEKLWDSFERMKTLEPGTDKRAQAEALLDRAAVPGTPMRHALAEEAKTLTTIGNSFRIRHSEVTQVPIDRSEQLDWLFVRMFSFLRLLLLSSSRSA